ncbi:MAG: NAD(+) diphosphatase [Deltaproteobacteria bacterium]|nr:NAD(+) diphosphatase [Deltaproteobacteria bacterium]
MSLDFLPGLEPPAAAEAGIWFVFRGREMLVDTSDDQPRPPRLAAPDELGLWLRRRNYLGLLDGLPAYTAEAGPAAQPPAGLAFLGLRDLYMILDEEMFKLTARAVMVLDWDRKNVYCGRCGRLLRPDTHERAKRCPACGAVVFPRLSPAVIMAVEDGDRILLGRNPAWPKGRYSTLAGFVEPGETLEETVAREVFEETGVQVGEVRYFGSQPWPFPDSLMVGFTARYLGGEIRVDGRELEHAAWFTPDNMPRLPPGHTISRKLINHFLARFSRPDPSPGVPLDLK